MEAIKEFKVGEETLSIYHDESPESPREWNNLTKMIFTGNHQHLGDKHNILFNGGYESREDFIERGEIEVRKVFKDVVLCKAVHLYSHSGETISTSYEYPYNCRWDSGTIGFVIVTKEDIRENFNIKNVTKKYIKRCEEILESEILVLNDYISGNVYGFMVEGGEEDSCWGFFGDDFTTNGLLEYIDDKFHELIKNN